MSNVLPRGGVLLAEPHPLSMQLAPDSEVPDALLASLAYGCAAVSLRRLHDGQGADMPVGAAAFDPSTGLLVGGFARDQEFNSDSPSHHAEQLALGHLVELGGKPNESTVAVSLVPCLACLEELAMNGVKRVVYITPRTFLEDCGLVNRRPCARTVAASGDYPELVLVENPEIRVASAGLFRAVNRDPKTGYTTYRHELDRPGRVNLEDLAKLAAVDASLPRTSSRVG